MITPLLFSLVVATAAPTATPVANVQADATVMTVADDGELGFMDKHMPFTLSDGMHPEIDDKMVIVWILTALFGAYAGPLWMPAIADVDMSDEYQSEAIITWLLHTGIIIGSAFLIGWTGIGMIVPAIFALYLYPVATLNMMNRHIDGKGKRKGASKKVPQGDLSAAAFSY